MRNIVLCHRGVLVRKDTLSNLEGKHRTNDMKPFLPKPLGTAEQDLCDANINENQLSMDVSKFNSGSRVVSRGHRRVKCIK